MLDVFMLTFGEPEADENFAILQEKAPHAKRIDGIEGLLNAHKACAEELEQVIFMYVMLMQLYKKTLHLNLHQVIDVKHIQV